MVNDNATVTPTAIPTSADSRSMADRLYRQGNELRRQGRFADAINSYIEAEKADADSPAREARRMLEDIMTFYCKDMYNP